MSRPTDSELNRAMALTCGYKPSDVHAYWDTPWGGVANGPPDFCRDRNELPTIYAALEAAGAMQRYLKSLARLVYDQPTHLAYGQAWAVHTAEPRLQVEAALRALGKWKDEWDATE